MSSVPHFSEQKALCSISSRRRSISLATGISLACVAWELVYVSLCFKLLSTTAADSVCEALRLSGCCFLDPDAPALGRKDICALPVILCWLLPRKGGQVIASFHAKPEVTYCWGLQSIGVLHSSPRKGGRVCRKLPGRQEQLRYCQCFADSSNIASCVSHRRGNGDFSFLLCYLLPKCFQTKLIL